MLKRILVWTIVLAIGYLIVGYVLVLLGWFDKDLYLTLSAIIGGVASVSGLLAFTTNKIERNDIENVGVEYFKRVVESAEELKLKEQELLTKQAVLTAKEKEIKELDIRKQEMELLVRKASMSLFLKDQLQRTESRILEIADENKELNQLLKQRQTILGQLTEIDGEIEVNPNNDLIKEVIESTKIKLQDKPRRKTPETVLEIMLAVSKEISNLLILRIK
jgi:hypothetical protein